MSFVAYKLIHIAGIVLLVTVLAGTCVNALNGARAYSAVVRAIYTVSILLVILGGFGMLARMNALQDGLPGWVQVKLGMWVALAAIAPLPFRSKRAAQIVLLALPLIAVLAGATALYKPF